MFVCLGALMWLYEDHTPAAASTAASIYLALHGSYGLVWYLKDKAFPDPGWQHRLTVPGAVNAVLAVLGWYWLFGWLLIFGRGGDHPIDDRPWFRGVHHLRRAGLSGDDRGRGADHRDQLPVGKGEVDAVESRPA